MAVGTHGGDIAQVPHIVAHGAAVAMDVMAVPTLLEVGGAEH